MPNRTSLVVLLYCLISEVADRNHSNFLEMAELFYENERMKLRRLLRIQVPSDEVFAARRTLTDMFKFRTGRMTFFTELSERLNEADNVVLHDLLLPANYTHPNQEVEQVL